MKVDDRLIQRIVADVLTRLGMSPAGEENEAVDRPEAQTVLSERVITEAALATQLNGNSSIIIGAETILTPSARDYLKAHKIPCCRENTDELKEESQSTSRKGRWRVITASDDSAVKRILEDLDKVLNADWSKAYVGQPAEVVSLAVSVLCRAEVDGVVVFSNGAGAERVVCRSNRNQRVRAAVVNDARKIDALIRQMGVNLIAIDPVGKSYFELMNLLRAVTKKGPPAVPTDWTD